MNQSAKRSIVWTVAALALGAGVAASGHAQSKPAMTDAQVEANVLRALAGVPELSTQNIQSATVYGEVTLSGNVHDEVLRTKAEEVVSRAEGVKKVVDELALGDTPVTPAVDAAPAGSPANGMATGNATEQVLQSDGTYAPAPDSAEMSPVPPDRGALPEDQTQSAQAPSTPNGPNGYGAQPPYNGQANNGPTYNGPTYNGPESYDRGQAPYAGQPGYPPPYPPPYGQYGRRSYSPPQRNSYGQGSYDTGAAGGQAAGFAVTVPGGANLQVRIDRGIDSNHIQPGTTFTGTVMSDVIASGVVAVPRGASVQGTVVDAERVGVLKGRGALALQLTSLTLGGQSYPVNTAVWDQEGRDKTLSTVNTTLGMGALGAVFGGLAGGGVGAAIGAGVGGAVGLGSSASSPNGRVIVPPESVLTFALAQPLAVKTVSQSEMQRLAYAAGSGPGHPALVRRSYYPGYRTYPGYGPVGPYAGYGGFGGYGPYAPYGPYGYPYGGFFYRR